MPKYIDWYLVEVESRIRDRIRIDRVHTMLKETEQHLSEIYDENLAAGMSDEDAQLAAIQRFGPVAQISGAALGREPVNGNHRAAMWAMGMVVIAALTVVGTVGLATSWTAWQFCFLSIVAIAVLFGGFTLASRRLLLLPIAGIVLTATVAVAVIAAQRFVNETSLLPRNLDQVLAELGIHETAIQKDLDLLRGINAVPGGSDDKPPAPYALANGQGYLIPMGVRSISVFQPVGYHVMVQRLSKGTVQNWQDARARWMQADRKLLGAQLQGSLNHVRFERNRLISFGAQSMPSVFAERMGESLPYGSLAFLSFSLINLAAYGLGRSLHRRRARSWLEGRLA